MAITAIGESQSFGYTSSVQEFVIPFNGVYKLETWGAQGGDSDYGGKGGYSVRYVYFKKNDIIYVCVGGTGSYNGGGAATYASGDSYCVYSGGGATHIATVSGQLKELSAYKDTGEILVVAGGGGGRGGKWVDGNAGGYGGGLSGGSARGKNWADESYTSSGGSQTSGFKFGQGGGGGSAAGVSGGGGGWYGGQATIRGGGAGGSGYIGQNSASYTVTFANKQYTNSTSGNVNKGNGRATITYVDKGVLFNFNGTEITELVYNGTNITSLNFNGTTVF